MKFSNKISHRRGFALVVVLAILVLVAALTVGFLVRAGSERSAAASFQAAAYSRHLADMAVNLVQGQINSAATQGSRVAWVSQPGMVRTFDVNGGLLNVYKLYSAKAMIAKLPDPGTDEPAANWYDNPALWTDLNAPVTVDKVANYPIMDPGDPSVANNLEIPGYFFDSSKAPIPPIPPGSTQKPAPMPVRWLYVLQDGKIVVPASDSGKTVTFSTSEVTSENPIVGRVAFWTDDDTCKVNINTASEGAYWDLPHAASADDMNLARYQPVRNEVQRYPGHPATTSLSAVLPKPKSPDTAYVLSDYLTIAPRVQFGGSKGGIAYDPNKISFDADRLYTSVDELIFKPGRKTNTNPKLKKTQLEQIKFLLTAHSRSPETNLFNLPRIACWPIYRLGSGGIADIKRTTVFDQLIELCASTGKLGTDTFCPYIFQRERYDSPGNDISIERNDDLYKYLQYLTSQPIPGFGSSLLQKYPNTRDQILTEIFDYIRCANLYDDNLANNSNPALANQFTPGKDSSGNNRIGHGWVAPTVRTQVGGVTTMGFGRSYSISEFGIGFICNADGARYEISGNSTSGNAISGNLSRTGAPALGNTSNSLSNKIFSASTVAPISPQLPPSPPLDVDEKVIQAIIVMEFFSPMLGWTGLRPNFTVEMDKGDLAALKVSRILPDGTVEAGSDQPLFPDFGLPATVNYVSYNEDQETLMDGRAWGGNPNWRYFGLYKGSYARGGLGQDSIGGNVKSLYPFISVPVKIKLPTTGGTGGVPLTFASTNFFFSGGPVTVKIYAGTSRTTTSLIQTLRIDLPPKVLQSPNLVLTNGTIATSGADGDRATTDEDWWTFSAGGNMPNRLGRLYFIRYWATDLNTDAPTSIADGTIRNGNLLRYGFDTVLTVAPLHGDYRLVAGRSVVDNQVFRETAAPTLGNSWSSRIEHFNDIRGKYFQAVDYWGQFAPDIPFNATVTPEATGDVDTSFPRAIDGPYINKPDEGNIYGLPGKVPYFDTWAASLEPGQTFFSPNRIMPSPGMFGSLPTGVDQNGPGNPWQTLLFRPQDNHPQSTLSRTGQSPDHLFLDLFWMPVVEPYAISDRFSTAGKINMNYRIMPFSGYLTRSTGIRAVLKAEKIAAIPTTAGQRYKEAGNGIAPIRKAIDNVQTLSQFEDRFNDATKGEVFKSASEICDIHIVPQGQQANTMEAFWKSNLLTGDNMRERIYTTLYPRLTTKSNTYTVHMRAQSLRKVSGSNANVWDENQDRVTGEYRGSTSIERFIDANKDITDYAGDILSIGTSTLDDFYRWRVIENRQFAP